MYSVNSGKWYSDVNINEVLRYSGVRDASKCSDDIIQSAVRAVNEVGEAASPKRVSMRCSLTINGDECDIDGIKVSSKSLSAHLKGCDEVILFAATLGSGVDTLIRRYSEVKMSYAVMLQGAAAELIEMYCDKANSEFEDECAAEGYYLRPRFSPGYGDFSIYHQPELISRLNAYKRIGLTISGGVQMTPMKSVTAVIGLTKRKQSGRTGSCASGKCAGCPNVNCMFRRV
ncbi:MAG: hypothetical protein ACI4IJ_10145 [Acutalibacteraceae bacterium]